MAAMANRPTKNGCNLVGLTEVEPHFDLVVAESHLQHIL